MRQRVMAIGLLSFLVLGGGRLAAASGPANFSGVWTLNPSKTSNLPSRLAGYRLRISQNAQQLTLKTEVKGNFQRPDTGDANARQYPRRQRGGYPGGGYPGGGMGIPGVGFPRRGGMGYPRMPGGRFPGGNRGGASRARRAKSAMALRMGPPDATYAFNGHSTHVTLKRPFSGDASVKTIWKKHGKVLQFTTLRDLQESNEVIESTESWQLSKNGSELKIQRRVKTPQGSEKVKLVFNRTAGDSQD